MRRKVIALQRSLKCCFISRQGVAKFLLRVKATGSITRQAGNGRPTKLTREVKEIVEEAMRNDDESTAVQLHAIHVDKQHILSLEFDTEVQEVAGVDLQRKRLLPNVKGSKQNQTTGVGNTVRTRGPDRILERGFHR